MKILLAIAFFLWVWVGLVVIAHAFPCGQVPTLAPASTAAPTATPAQTKLIKPEGLPSYKVWRVVDGDTVRIEPGKQYVRLLGINAPELKKKEPGAEAARDWLKSQVEGRSVEIELAKRKDKYGRLLGVLWSGSQNINAALLDAGLVRGMFEYPSPYKDAFAALELAAKQSRRGVWR